MGWTYTNRPKGTSNRDWFARELGSQYEILADATVRNVWYAAARRVDLDNGEVFALIFPIQWVPKDDYYNFGYKDQDETVGPYATDAPAKVLDLLTPTTYEYAVEWREKCRNKIARKAARPKVKAGDTIKFTEPIKFEGGAVLDTFQLVKRDLLKNGYQQYRVPRWRDRNYEKVS